MHLEILAVDHYATNHLESRSLMQSPVAALPEDTITGTHLVQNCTPTDLAGLQSVQAQKPARRISAMSYASCAMYCIVI